MTRQQCADIGQLLHDLFLAQPQFHSDKIRPGILIEVAVTGQHLQRRQMIFLASGKVVFAMPRRGMHDACSVGHRDIIHEH